MLSELLVVCLMLLVFCVVCEIHLNLIIDAVLTVILTGYFWPPLERPPINNVGFQLANHSNMPAPPMTGGFLLFCISLFFFLVLTYPL